MIPVSNLAARLREFVGTEVIPAEPELDAADATTRSRLRAAATAAGLFGLALPAEHGGGGLPLGDYLAVAEHEGASDYGPAILNSDALLNVRMIGEHAHAELGAAVLGPLARGDVRACYAMTEPGVSGSDPAGIRTRAEPNTDGSWTITGGKWFVTGAGSADLAVVFARTGDAEPKSAFSLFLVPTDAPGFRVERELDVLGAGGQHEIVLDRVRVPELNLIGGLGRGLGLAGGRLALGRTLRALRWVGQAQRALELLRERAAGRRSGAGVLADHQLVQGLAFEAELAVRSARLLVAEAGALVADGRRAGVEVAMAKVAAARGLERAVDAAIQVYGAEGLTAASTLPRLLRWSRAARILDGSTELLIATAGRKLLHP